MKHKIAASDVPANTRRGGALQVLLGPATVGSTAGFMGLLTLGPGEFVSEHYHPYSEEFLYVVRGELILSVDGTAVPLSGGEAAHVPIGMRHRLTNASAQEALIVFCLGPLAPRPELGHVDTEPLPLGADETPQPQVGGVS